MVCKSSIIQQVVNSKSLPGNSELLKTLLEFEKNAKKNKRENSLADLSGGWNLRFITGTKKSRERTGIVLGAGRYIPRLLKIKIHYQTNPQFEVNTGRVKNEVQLGWLNLSLTGPIRFITSKNILAFDFTHIDIMFGGFKLYSGYVKKGLEKEAKFYDTKLKHQAFFSYFLIQENVIAARGKGGGLALWTKEELIDRNLLT